MVQQQGSGRKVLVVQASAYTKYLGNLTVRFDAQGEVASWEGNPIFMSNDKPQGERSGRRRRVARSSARPLTFDPVPGRS